MQLKTITVANGYWSEIGVNRVFIWRDLGAEPLKREELTCLEVRDPLDTVAREGSGSFSRYHRTLNLEIRGATVTPNIHESMRKLVQDVSKCVMPVRKWGGLAEDTNLVEDRVGTEKTEYLYGGMILKVAIEYRVKDTDPTSV